MNRPLHLRFAATHTLSLVCSGSGNSTLINALFRDNVVQASGGVFACTSVATKVAYHPEDFYRGMLYFIKSALGYLPFRLELMDYLRSGPLNG